MTINGYAHTVGEHLLPTPSWVCERHTHQVQAAARATASPLFAHPCDRLVVSWPRQLPAKGHRSRESGTNRGRIGLTDTGCHEVGNSCPCSCTSDAVPKARPFLGPTLSVRLTSYVVWPKMADAIGQIQSQRFNGPTAIVMAPRRWAWLLAAVDSTGHPLISTDAAGPHNAQGVQQSNGYGVPVGNMLGLPVITSGAVPINLGAGTNEDRIIFAAWDDLVIAEDKSNAPAQLRFDDVGSGSLTVRLVAYGYSAAALGRQPKAISVISGTGLVTPVL